MLTSPPDQSHSTMLQERLPSEQEGLDEDVSPEGTSGQVELDRKTLLGRSRSRSVRKTHQQTEGVAGSYIAGAESNHVIHSLVRP